jgi:hypothetical protein
MFCSKCGKQIEEGSKFCKECGTRVGEPVVQQQFLTENYEKQRYVSLELITGIISLLLSPFLLLWTAYCFGSLGDQFDLWFSIVCGIMFLVAPIVGITTRNNVDKGGAINAGRCYLISALCPLFILITKGVKEMGLCILIIFTFSSIFFYCAYRKNKTNTKLSEHSS